MHSLDQHLSNQRGGAWHDCQLNLEADFDLEFTVNFGTTDADGADGIVFVLQPFGVGNNVIGSTGGSIGYENGPFNPSLAVEMDTWQNADVGDPWFDHIALTSDGSIFTTWKARCRRTACCPTSKTAKTFRSVWCGTPTRKRWKCTSTATSGSRTQATSWPRFWWRPARALGLCGVHRGAVGNQQRFCLVEADYTTHPESVRLDLRGRGKCASATSWC